MSMEHAREWCSSDASKGRAHGTCWAFFFTSVGKFLENHGLGSKLDARKLVDDGRFDKTFVELGLRKFGFDEFPDVLGPFGLEVIL